MPDVPLPSEILSKLGDQVLAAAQIMADPKAWAETFLVTPTTGQRFRANFIQNRILTSNHRFNVIRVHRRGGKSYGMAVLALFYALTQPSFEILIICPSSSQVMNLFNTLREFIRVNEWIEPYKKSDKQAPQLLQFTNGSRIVGYTTGAKSKGAAMGVRGQGADVLLIDEAAYLNQEDWPTLIPIMQGDKHRRGKVRVFVASTPAQTRGYYYEFCTNPRMKEAWHEIHVSILDNEEVDEAFRNECKALCLSELDWKREYLADFPEVGEGVFPRNLVLQAKKIYRYQENLARAEAEIRTRQPNEPGPNRTIGVDWDKWNEDGHGPNIAVLERTPYATYRVIYREEIPQSNFSLDNAVKRIIRLNEIFDPDWIYVDRGYGEYQIETLHKYGMGDRASRLDKKVVGIAFNENVEFTMPGGGVETKRFKQAMIQLLRGWFEKSLLELSEYDDQLIKQFLDFHIVTKTDHTLKFSEENEHGIDAVGLAAMAMFQRVYNPYAAAPATKSYVVPAPEPVPSTRLHDWRQHPSLAGNVVKEDSRRSFASFDRSRLGDFKPGSRSSF